MVKPQTETDRVTCIWKASEILVQPGIMVLIKTKINAFKTREFKPKNKIYNRLLNNLYNSKIFYNLNNISFMRATKQNVMEKRSDNIVN